MKKIFGVLFALYLALSPLSTALAAELETVNLEEYETLNFKEALASENIELTADYKESDDQVIIYLFRGQGCGYCKAFLTFLNSITKEYGKYFKVVSFESWGNQENSALMEKLSAFVDGQSARGVPYIIIGEQAFPGYASDYDEAIKSTIKSLYEQKDRYDVIEEYNKYVKSQNKQDGTSSAGVIVWNAVFITIATIVIIRYISCSNKKMLKTMGYIPSEVAFEAEEEINEVEANEETEDEKPKAKKTKVTSEKKHNK